MTAHTVGKAGKNCESDEALFINPKPGGNRAESLA
jgi:hypothetical protein